MSILLRSLVATALLLAALPGAEARAEPAAAKDAVLGFLKTFKPQPGAGALHWGDAIEALPSPSGEGDLVRVPDLRWAAPKGELRIGTVEILVVAAPTVDGHPRQRLSLTLPPELPFFDEVGRLGAKLTIAQNHLSGIWAPEYRQFTQFDLSWKTVIFADPQGTPAASADAVTFNQDGSESGTTWTGTMAVTLAGFEIASPTGGVHIAEIKQSWHGDNLALGAISDIGKEIDALVPPLDPAQITPADIARILPIIDQAPRLADGVSGTTRILGVSARTPQGQPISLGGIAFETTIARKEPGLAEIGMSLALDGIDTSAVPLPPIIPDRAGFSIRLTGLPADRLWQLSLKGIKASDSKEPERAGKMVEDELTAIAKSSDARLKVDLGFGSPSYSGVLGSTLRFDGDSPYRVSGEALLTIAGLDDTLKTLGGLPASPQIQQTIMTLTVAKGLGAARADKGAVVYDYAFRLDSSGKILLNGQDLQALMAQQAPPPGQGQARPQPKARPAPK